MALIATLLYTALFTFQLCSSAPIVLNSAGPVTSEGVICYWDVDAGTDCPCIGPCGDAEDCSFSRTWTDAYCCEPSEYCYYYQESFCGDCGEDGYCDTCLDCCRDTDCLQNYEDIRDCYVYKECDYWCADGSYCDFDNGCRDYCGGDCNNFECSEVKTQCADYNIDCSDLCVECDRLRYCDETDDCYNGCYEVTCIEYIKYCNYGCSGSDDCDVCKSSCNDDVCCVDEISCYDYCNCNYVCDCDNNNCACCLDCNRDNNCDCENDCTGNYDCDNDNCGCDCNNDCDNGYSCEYDCIYDYFYGCKDYFNCKNYCPDNYDCCGNDNCGCDCDNDCDYGCTYGYCYCCEDTCDCKNYCPDNYDCCGNDNCGCDCYNDCDKDCSCGDNCGYDSGYGGGCDCSYEYNFCWGWGGNCECNNNCNEWED